MRKRRGRFLQTRRSRGFYFLKNLSAGRVLNLATTGLSPAIRAATAKLTKHPGEGGMVVVTDNIPDFGYRVLVLLEQQLGGLYTFIDTVLAHGSAVHRFETAFELGLRDTQVLCQGR